ncbi:MAG TPA: lysylphosphatidylglycerol synthase transmembrane domain-containing protein [Candidatus Acidoferrales bacterium]|nr:lysylphosphatidylglycerol synthase transmembrane domain-containing protein [Candidatus Acidoferrales bacterium]
MTAASPRRIPSWLPQVLGYGLSAGSLIWVLHGYPMNELLPNIRSLDWRWVAIAILTDLSVFVVHGWRWNTLLFPVARLGFWTTVQCIYIGLFANEVLPLRVGEIIRCYLMGHWNNLRLSLAFASVAVERIIDGFWLLIAFVIAAGFIKHLPHDPEAARLEEKLNLFAWSVAAAVLLASAALCWIVLRKHQAHAGLIESRWAATLRHIVEGLKLMGSLRTLGLTSIISLFYLALQVLFVFALMKAYGFDLSFWVAGGILTIVRMSTVVPNAPGNLGLVNFAVVVALRLFEVETNDAKTFSLIYYAVQTFPLLVGGAIATALTGLNIGELRDRARQHMNEVHAE